MKGKCVESATEKIKKKHVIYFYISIYVLFICPYIEKKDICIFCTFCIISEVCGRIK